MNKMDSKEKDNTLRRYEKRYSEFGYSPQSLGWLKGKQNIRFINLLSEYNANNKHILDIGCGFGDLNLILEKKFASYKYTGCDLYEKFILEGKKRYLSANFICGDFLELPLESIYDWAIASGPFNHIFEKNNNYDFIESVMKKAYSVTKDGFSFDFINDKVDYKDEGIFYANPEKILSIAYSLSRNIILKNNYMPFEFSIFVFKDDSFNENIIYNKWLTDENF